MSLMSETLKSDRTRAKMKHLRAFCIVCIGGYFVYLGFMEFILTPSREFAEIPSENTPNEIKNVHLQQMAQFLEKDQKVLLNQPPLRAPSAIASLPFSHEYINNIESPELRAKLNQLNSENSKSLLKDMHAIISALDASQWGEKLKLIKVSFEIERLYHCDVSRDFFLNQAEQSMGSSDQNVAEYGRQALEFFLYFESDMEKRDALREDFVLHYSAARKEHPHPLLDPTRE